MRDYGKKFEEITRAALLAEGVCHDRLPDQVSGQAGSTNPSDFTAYKKPDYLYIECKSCQSERFDIKSRISEGQWVKLLDKSKYQGVYAGYLIWFVNQEKVFWISAPKMQELYAIKKSFTINEVDSYAIPIQIKMNRKYPVLINLVSTIVSAYNQDIESEV